MSHNELCLTKGSNILIDLNFKLASKNGKFYITVWLQYKFSNIILLFYLLSLWKITNCQHRGKLLVSFSITGKTYDFNKSIIHR